LTRPRLQRLRDRLPGAFLAGRSPASWFEVTEIASGSWLIHEHRYWQVNSNYLLVGDDEALLVDTGSGLSDLRAVVTALTDRPVRVLPTHLHWDHIGGIECFDRHALLDVPANRRLVRDGRLRTSYRSSFSLTGHTFRVDDWIEPDTRIDLGGRVIETMATPGHSPDGLTLIDRAAKVACVGDLIYEGTLLANLPGASLSGYSNSLAALRARIEGIDLLLPGHGPPLRASLVRSLSAGLTRIATAKPRVGFPRKLPLTDEVAILLGYRASRR